MNKLLHITFVALCTVFLSSCGGLNLLTFDQMDAADINFPNSVKRVAVLSTMQPFDYSEKSMEVSEQMRGDGQITAETLANALADAQYFDKVIIADSLSALPMADKRWSLSPNDVRGLTKDLDVDMLIAVEHLGMDSRLDQLYIPEFIDPVYGIHSTVETLLRVYLPEQDKPLYTIAKRDSAVWDFSSTLTPKAFVRDASEFGAYSAVNCFVPHWVQATRYYYDGGPLPMREAGVFVREQNWAEALNLWTALYDKKKKGKQAMKAAYNIALYHEMTDNINEACKWIDIAASLVSPNTVDQKYVELYRKVLSERQQKITRLNMQMQRFQDIFEE